MSSAADIGHYKDLTELETVDEKPLASRVTLAKR